MKKILSFLFTLVVAAQMLVAQENAAPNYAEIRFAINNSKSENHYPKLLSRYCENDSTLTLQQMRYLYYGYTLQEDFIPYQSTDLRLYDLRRTLIASAGNVHICNDAIISAQKVLDNNPFDIPAINTITIAYLQMGDTVAYNSWNNRQQGLLDVILSSGDGETPETAFHVINVEHEYEIINRLGLTIESDSLCSEEIEYLKIKNTSQQLSEMDEEESDVEEEEKEETGYYFNFGACRKAYHTRYE